MKKICLFAFIGLLLWAGPLPRSARAQEPPAPAAAQTIQSEEIRDAAEDAAMKKVSLARVEQSRALTPERLYGLAGFWLLIAVAVCLIRYQLRDDEKLYQEGYYNKNLE